MSTAPPSLLGAALVVAVVAGTQAAQGQSRIEGGGAPPTGSVRLTRPHWGGSGPLLRAALAAPHLTRFADSTAADLPRDSTFASSVIIVARRGGRGATVASTVRGDVIVVNGDLFVHPGARIEGRAVSIGGCVYASTLATVAGTTVCFRDESYAVERGAGGIVLAPAPASASDGAWFRLPGFRGFAPPGYDRVNGVSLSWGPAFGVDTARLGLHPRVTYRSDLGTVDPAVRLRLGVGERTAFLASASRASVTNEGWIRSDLVNGVGALVSGNDVRNYYRAERFEAQLGRAFGGDGADANVFAGALTERAHGVNPDSTSSSAPFSLLNRRDRADGMLRANPQGIGGRITSALAGATAAMRRDDFTGRAGVTVELPFEAPRGARFVQTTVDAETGFSALANHRVIAALHGVITTGDSTPRQRYSYLGGSGTLPTEDVVLGFGGDALLFVDGVYIVPLERVRVPLLGSPSVAVRYAAGSAGVRTLPRFIQNVGLRLIVGLARVDILVNPATGESALGYGIAALR